jgi:hypothetical protein
MAAGKMREEGQPMSEDIHLPPTSVEFPFSHDYLMALFDERAPAERALDALRSTGFADDAVALVPPDRVNSDLSERDPRRAPSQQSASGALHTEADAEDLADEAAVGHWIMRVYAPERRQRDQAEALLKRHGAHDLTFYG